MGIEFNDLYKHLQGLAIESNDGESVTAILAGPDDPTVVDITDGSDPLPIGTVYIRTNVTEPEIYVKSGAGANSWEFSALTNNPNGAGVLGVGSWRFESTLTPPPGNARFRFNSADLTTATALYLDYDNKSGGDLTNILQFITPPALVYVQQAKDATSGFVAQISASTDQGTYIEYTLDSVTSLDGTTTLPTNRDFTFFFAGFGSSFEGFTVQEDDVNVNTTVDTLNFEGTGVDTTDEGAGKVTVTITDTTVGVELDDVSVTDPVTIMNFEGSAITSVVDEGSGKVTITATDTDTNTEVDLQLNDASVVSPLVTLNFEGTAVTSITDDGAGKGTVTLTDTDTIIELRVDGIPLINPLENLNITGNANVTDDGGNTATIDILGIDIEQDDGSVSTDNTTLNFEGLGVTVTDEGAGKTTVDISSPIVENDRFDAYNTTVVNLVGGWAPITMDVVKENQNFTHTAGNANVEFDVAGRYLVIGKYTANSGNNRSGTAGRLTLDTGGGFNEILGTQSWSYHRNTATGEGSATSIAIVDASIGDQVQLEAQRLTGTVTMVTVPNQSSLTIVALKGIQGDPGAQGPIGPSGAPASALAQARQATGLVGVPLVWTDFDFPITDQESEPTIVDHLTGTPDRIQVLEDGWYECYYSFTCDDEIQGRMRVDDTTVIPGSFQQSGDPTDVNQILAYVACKVYIELTAGQFVTCQVQAATTAENIVNESVFSVRKLDGIQGEQGPQGSPGAGQSVELQEDDGTIVAVLETINFEGNGVTVTDNGSNKATVTIVGATTMPSTTINADMFTSPVSADWAVNALAPLSIDTNSSALSVRRFDDTTEEGVGFTLRIPTGATSMTFNISGRAETGPGGVQGVVPLIYRRTISDNGTITAWSAGTAFTPLSIPTNEFFQNDSQTFRITTLGLAADTVVQFELTRSGVNASDTLTGDWDLLQLNVVFA